MFVVKTSHTKILRLQLQHFTWLMLGGISSNQSITELLFAISQASFSVCISLTEAAAAMTEPSSGRKTSSTVTEIRTKILQWHHREAGPAVSMSRVQTRGSQSSRATGHRWTWDQHRSWMQENRPHSCGQAALRAKLPTEAEGKGKAATPTCRDRYSKCFGP